MKEVRATPTGAQRELNSERRNLLKHLAAATSASLFLPAVIGCSTQRQDEADVFGTKDSSSTTIDPSTVPVSRPENFNPIEFNLQRGLLGAIPASYHPSILGADGPLVHLGKHMAYIAPVDKTTVPAGYVAIMMGEFAKGYTRHVASGTHWYDWISVRKEGAALNRAVVTNYASWPDSNNAVFGAGLITDASGVNTIYYARLPAGVQASDTICVVAHCNIHGEYISFITL